MNKSEEKMNIYQKMDLVRVKVGIVQKSIEMQIGNNRGYKAVSETDILKAVNEAEHEVGLISYQESIDILESEKLDTQKGSMFRIRILCKVRVVNIDNPSESVVFVGLGDGFDTMDKGCGKANAYAMKYALMRGYKIPTGDDPDYFKSEPIVPLASEDDIKTYINLIGLENVDHSCKRLGVKSLNELPQNVIRERIEIRKRQLAEQDAIKGVFDENN